MPYRALSQLLVATLVTLLWLPVGPALAAAQETLEIYLVDVEGGGATLFVSPEGETLLIDTGNGGEAAARDAGRIRAAMRDAGVTEIDHLITTHWHGDHTLGLPGLIQSMGASDYNKTLEIYGPKGTKKHFDAMFMAFVFDRKMGISCICFNSLIAIYNFKLSILISYSYYGVFRFNIKLY